MSFIIRPRRVADLVFEDFSRSEFPLGYRRQVDGFAFIVVVRQDIHEERSTRDRRTMNNIILRRGSVVWGDETNDISGGSAERIRRRQPREVHRPLLQTQRNR